MPYVNYQSVSLRDSAATTATDTDGVDDTIALPPTVTSLWVTVIKTAEANIDNLLTVRLQAYVNTVWIDVPWNITQFTPSLTSAPDAATSVTRAPNIFEAFTSATFVVTAFYSALPSSTVRSIWIASGTAVSHTFEVVASFRENEQ